MQTTKYRIAELLNPGKSSCYQIPPFQRNYQWREHQWHHLVHDIRAAAARTGNGEALNHWIGIILLGHATRPCALKEVRAGHCCYEILDGQQRYLTLQVWMLALLDEYRRQTDEHHPGYQRDEYSQFSVHALDSEDWAGLQKGPIAKPDDVAKWSDFLKRPIAGAYWYFRFLMYLGEESFNSDEPTGMVLPDRARGYVGSRETLSPYWDSIAESEGYQPVSIDWLNNTIWATLEKLTLAAIVHEPTVDEPMEVVFQTLNSDRVPLGQFDLVRNFLLIKSAKVGNAQRDLYMEHLHDAEVRIDKARLDLRSSNLDRFLYDFMIARGSTEQVKMDGTARDFTAAWTKLSAGRNVKKFLDETLAPSMGGWLAASAAASTAFIGRGERKVPSRAVRALMRIENFSRGPLTPLTSRLVAEWMSRHLSDDQLVEQLCLIEVFIARFVLSGQPLSPMRRLVMSACTDVFGERQGRLDDWVRAHSPTDDRVRAVLTQSCASPSGGDPDPGDWLVDDVGERLSSRQLCALFDGLNELLEGTDDSRVLVRPPGTRESKSSTLTIEHLYPKREEKWLPDLARWSVTASSMELRRQSLGNLTVLPFKFNASQQNGTLLDKQAAYRKNGVPSYKLTRDFEDSSRWSTVEIDLRTRKLTDLALTLWKLS